MSNTTHIPPNEPEGYRQLHLLAAFQQMDSAAVRLLYVAKGSKGSGQVEFWLRSLTTLYGQEERYPCLGCALRAIYERGFLMLMQTPHAHSYFDHMVASILDEESQQQTGEPQKSIPQLLVMLQRGLLQAQAAWEQISRLSPEMVQAIEQEYVVDRDLAAFIAAREPAASEEQGGMKTTIAALCRVMDAIFMLADSND